MPVSCSVMVVLEYQTSERGYNISSIQLLVSWLVKEKHFLCKSTGNSVCRIIVLLQLTWWRCYMYTWLGKFNAMYIILIQSLWFNTVVASSPQVEYARSAYCFDEVQRCLLYILLHVLLFDTIHLIDMCCTCKSAEVQTVRIISTEHIRRYVIQFSWFVVTSQCFRNTCDQWWHVNSCWCNVHGLVVLVQLQHLTILMIWLILSCTTIYLYVKAVRSTVKY